jgi:hypothetical protein
VIVKLLVGRPCGGLTLKPGDECDLPQDEAVRLIARGDAVPVAEAAVERAVKKPIRETRKA